MYESYFNLKTKPFDLVPNPDFLFLSRSHKKALTYLDYGIRERAGFILLTGEIGSGKTTIIRDLIKKHRGSLVISKVFNTRVDSVELLAMINDDFGLPVHGKDKVTLLRELNEFLIEHFGRGERPVLVIDEAQNLSFDILEEIRMLSNLETDSAKLLQIILVGQPELKKMLAASEMTQLRQRISIGCHVNPLSREETEHYILHRLETAGNRDAVHFTDDALEVVFRFSRGVPRLINIICDFLMLSAFAEETRVLDGTMARDIVGDLDFESRYWGPESGDPVAGLAEAETTPGTASANNSGVEPLLRDIIARLDRLEVERGSSSPHLGEMAERMSALENAFRFHVTETESSVTEMRRTVERANGNQVSAAVGEEEKTGRGGLFRRMFGGGGCG